MLHKAWSSIEEVPYYFSRLSVKFQGHTALKIVKFDSDWAFPDCNSSLNSPMATKCCTKLSQSTPNFNRIQNLIEIPFVGWLPGLTFYLLSHVMRESSQPVKEDNTYVTPITGSDSSHVTQDVRLTHRGRDIMAAIFLTTFSNAFYWMKMFEFRLRFHQR